MTTFDIRKEGSEEITKIVFADEAERDYDETARVFRLVKDSDGPFILVEDENGTYVVVDTKERTLNLIKALNKAIELGWVK